jgi:hypothetical protein
MAADSCIREPWGACECDVMYATTALHAFTPLIAFLEPPPQV